MARSSPASSCHLQTEPLGFPIGDSMIVSNSCIGRLGGDDSAFLADVKLGEERDRFDFRVLTRGGGGVGMLELRELLEWEDDDILSQREEEELEDSERARDLMNSREGLVLAVSDTNLT